MRTATKLLLRAAALCALISPASAANVSPPNGSLEMIYTNAAGTTAYAPYATVSNADATTFITWCESHYSNVAGANTAAGCFNVWFDDVVNQAMQNANAAAAAGAAATATANAAKITITPAQ
jgi:hypothetical protein